MCCSDRLNPPPKAAFGGLEIQLPLYPRKQTQLGNRGMSEKCRYCCKSRNRTTQKISRKSISGLLCCCVASQRPYEDR
jgi:hypothetical protein